MLAFKLPGSDESDSLEMFEGFLRDRLRPVNPDPDFVHTLYDRLITSSPVRIEQRMGLKIYFIILFGLLSGMFIFWLLRRMRKLF